MQNVLILPKSILLVLLVITLGYSLCELWAYFPYSIFGFLHICTCLLALGTYSYTSNSSPLLCLMFTSFLVAVFIMSFEFYHLTWDVIIWPQLSFVLTIICLSRIPLQVKQVIEYYQRLVFCTSAISLWVLDAQLGLSAQNLVKVQLLKAYSSVRKFDMLCFCVCFSETYLSSSFHFDNENLDIFA